MTKERGLVKAGSLSVGEHLLDPVDNGWNRIEQLWIEEGEALAVHFEDETLTVSETHLFMDKAGEWRSVFSLCEGEVLSGDCTFVGFERIGKEKISCIVCERHRYKLGNSASHNTSFN